MFERFTERARQVVVLGQEEARALRHNYIGTEHILLGLLREEEGLAAQVLESLHVTLEEVREQVDRIIGPGDEAVAGQIPFTPRAKRVLELALREALELGHNHIGTEHILLGLVRENEGVAARILLEFDVDAEQVRNAIVRLLDAERSRGMRPRRSPVPSLRRGRCEYRTERLPNLDALTTEWLNAIGEDGWSLAGVLQDNDEIRLVFQRPAPPGPPPPPP
jgi:ATP-dependent Clp protease ATP-binding subunit ClpA